MDIKQYLEYLDKEMTIMGILSAVAVAAPGGILSAVLAGDSGVKATLWNTEQFFIVGASVLCVIAAFCFYKERSELAWFYGQISLKEVLGDKKSVAGELREWLRDTDSWETWWPYSWGFTFLVTGFIEYLSAVFFYLVPAHWNWLSTHLHGVRVWAFWICPVVAGLLAMLQYYVLVHYKFSDDYWADFGSDVFRWVRRRKRPHDGVYARLKPSPIHGVGVFAISDIPKGTYIFEPDDDKLVSVSEDETRALPSNLPQLYVDFCVLKNKTYQCPTSFNKLTPAWYLNTSKTPNVAADSSLRFYAIREIRSVEELTADYDAYSDNDSGGPSN
jgi:hypothetical protein